MTIVKYVAALVSGFALLAVAPVFALTVSTGATGNVGVNASSTDVNVNVSGSADASGQGSGSAGSSNGSSASGSGNASVGATTDLSVPLVVTRADVDDNTVQASSVTATGVQTKADLSGYIAAQMQGDTNVSNVDSASDHVAVTYPEQAKLFGFIPVTIDTTATTDASGNVTITQPWWSFLAASDQSALQASVQASVSGVLGTNPSSASATVSSTAQLSASEQAKLVAAIKDTMAAAANASASANADANASGSVQSSY